MANPIHTLPKLFARADFTPASVNDESRTVEVVWTTGEKVKRSSYYDGDYNEELSLDPKHVRMGRLASGTAPFLSNHDGRSIDSVLGVITSARLEGGRGVATVRFAKDDPAADAAWNKVRQGILPNVSVGYKVHRFEKVEGGDAAVPTFRATDWEPYEVSLVPMGADSASHVRGDTDLTPCEFITSPRGAPQQEQTQMIIEETEQQKRTAELKQATDAAVKVALERVSGIRSAVRAAKLGEDVAEKLIADEKVSLSDARAIVLEKLAARSEEAPIASHIQVGEAAEDKFVRGVTAQLYRKAGGDVVKRAQAAKVAGFDKIETDPAEFRSWSLMRIAEECLRRARMPVHGDKLEIAGRALTMRATGYSGTADFTVLFENVMNKLLLGAYATTPDTWSRFCKTDTVPDFRAANRYRLGSFGTLDSKNEHGEFKNKAIADGEKSQISVGTKGNIIALTREAMINDDMGAMADLASRFGRAARLSIEVDVYALLAQNAGLGPTMSDGLTLFHATHKNISTGATLSAASLDTDRTLMAYQTDPSGNEILDLSPAVLLVPKGLEAQAKVINGSVYDPDANNKLQKPNPVAGLYRDIVATARLAAGTTRRYSFADPGVAPALVVAFLEGQGETPFLEQHQGFRVDGTEWKVRLDYGVQAFDWRGATTNAGV